MNDLTLHANSLLSKWGNGDGDILFDWWHDTFRGPLPVEDDHALLCSLVENHLLPVIADHGHTFEFVRIETIHNPARLRTLNGIEVDWRNPDDSLLAGIYVTISATSVKSALAQTTEPLRDSEEPPTAT